MTVTSTFHFTVPNTEINYTIKLGYEGNVLRSFEVISVSLRGRPTKANELPDNIRHLYLDHLQGKINNIRIVK